MHGRAVSRARTDGFILSKSRVETRGSLRGESLRVLESRDFFCSSFSVCNWVGSSPVWTLESSNDSHVSCGFPDHFRGREKASRLSSTAKSDSRTTSARGGGGGRGGGGSVPASRCWNSVARSVGRCAWWWRVSMPSCLFSPRKDRMDARGPFQNAIHGRAFV